MNDNFGITISGFYANERVIDQVTKAIQDWSSNYKNTRRYGWIKTAPHNIILFITPKEEITGEQKANLYFMLIQIDGFSFICRTFN